MLIELWRKVLPDEPTTCSCGVCGNDFERGSVCAVAATDHGVDMGFLCPVCLEYLNRRKLDAQDPTLGNWPARDWPTIQDLAEALSRYPEPMFANAAELKASFSNSEEELDVYDAAIVWRMAPAQVGR
jgi:hypothetical protein